MIQWKIVAVEAAVLLASLKGLVDTVLNREAPISPELLQQGQQSLRPDYRRKVDRTVGGIARRFRIAVEVAVRRFARRRLFA